MAPSMATPIIRRSSNFGRQSQTRASLGGVFQSRESGLGIETDRLSYVTDNRDSMMSRISEVVSYGSEQDCSESEDDLPTQKSMFYRR